MDIRNRLTRLHPNLLNYAFMLTSCRDAANDLLSETKAAAAASGANVSVDDESFKGWAFDLMRSIFEKRFSNMETASRRSNTSTASSTDGAIYGITISRAGDESLPEGTYSVRDVTHILSILGAEYRRPAELYFSGYGLTEIADELNISLGALEHRLSYCMTWLRVNLSLL